MADPFATAADYIARTAKSLTAVQETQVTALLVDASALIRSRLPSGFVPDPDMARAVAIAIVRRAVANPGGLRSRMVGGWQESYGEDGGLYVTDAEVDSLTPDEDEEGQAYTVTMLDAGFGEGATLYRHHRHVHHHPNPGHW